MNRLLQRIPTICFLFFTLSFISAKSQTLGGSSVFNFLRFPNTPQLTALGSVNISNISNDVGLSFNNPSQLRREMHGQANFVFNSMYASINNYHLSGAYHAEKLKTSFSGGVNYFDYGNIPQTDAAGNTLGDFHPNDYVVQISASRRYMERWFYGATFKFINSNYGLYRSNGIALDIGASYYDSTNLLQVSLLMKNMGMQLKEYEGSASDEIPFDLQLGITKRLKKAPIQFSLTAHHLHQFDIRYNDTAFNNENDFEQNNKNSSFTIDKIFRHFVFATQFYIADKIELTAAYNHLRRSELNIPGTSNGLNGFSLGVGVLLNKLQIRYARGYYQNNTAYNQFGLNVQLNEIGRKKL